MFLFALISTILELIKTPLVTYYFAAIFVAFGFTLASYFVREVGKNGS